MEAPSPGTQPRDAPSLRLVHAICVFALLLAGAVIAAPLADGGFKYYVDNPVHLIEVESLARGESWSEIALCGLPLGYLHSPVWYGLLARLVAAGLSAESLYFAALYLGFVAPSLAVYGVGQRRSSPGIAFFVAYLVLVLPASTFGMGSALAGMWTFHLGIAFLVLYADSLMRPQRGSGGRQRSALWLAMVALSHHFVLVAAVLLSFVALLLRQRDEAEPKLHHALFEESPVWMVGALASTAYWAPMLLTLDPGVAGTQDLPLYKLGLRLFLPTDIMRILATSDEGMIRTQLFLTETIIHLALLASAGLAARGLRRDGASIDAGLHKLGLAYAAAFLLILVISAFVNLPFLGPLSWRYVAFVHLGLALAALGYRWPGSDGGAPSSSRLIPAAVFVVASGWWWGKPLQGVKAFHEHEEVQALERSWDFVAKLPREDGSTPSRVYVQNAFNSFYGGPLDAAHTTILAWRVTGRPQSGSFYGVHPFATGLWTKSGWGALFGNIELDRARFLARTRRSNTSTIIISYPYWREFLSTIPEWEEVYVDGRFSVWQAKAGGAGWAMPGGPEIEVRSVDYAGPSLDVTVQVNQPGSGAGLETAIAHHDWWTLDGPGVIEKDKGGLITVRELPRGEHQLRLRWAAPAWPRLTSVLGWLLLVAWGAVARRRESESSV